MLQAAGKRVHVYTSPHLVRFHERIELAGADGKARPIGEAELVDVLARTQRANAGDAITFFEITTAAAFLAFAEHPADAVILEVGLGGRLDATNVVARPALSRHHADLAGPRRQARRHARRRSPREKAGILKRRRAGGRSRSQPDEALDVIRARRRRGAARRSSSGARTTRPSSSAAASSIRAPSGSWTCRCRP